MVNKSIHKGKFICFLVLERVHCDWNELNFKVVHDGSTTTAEAIDQTCYDQFSKKVINCKHGNYEIARYLLDNLVSPAGISTSKFSLFLAKNILNSLTSLWGGPHRSFL